MGQRCLAWKAARSTNTSWRRYSVPGQVIDSRPQMAGNARRGYAYLLELEVLKCARAEGIVHRGGDQTRLPLGLQRTRAARRSGPSARMSAATRTRSPTTPLAGCWHARGQRLDRFDRALGSRFFTVAQA